MSSTWPRPTTVFTLSYACYWRLSPKKPLALVDRALCIDWSVSLTSGVIIIQDSQSPSEYSRSACDIRVTRLPALPTYRARESERFVFLRVFFRRVARQLVSWTRIKMHDPLASSSTAPQAEQQALEKGYEHQENRVPRLGRPCTTSRTGSLPGVFALTTLTTFRQSLAGMKQTKITRVIPWYDLRDMETKALRTELLRL